MQRIARARSATLTQTFYENGVPTDPSPDAATVTITRDDGTVIVTDAATVNAGTGVASYTLTPDDTANLDLLTVTWTAEFGGSEQTYTDTVEIVGGFLFTVAQAKALSGLASKTTQQIIDARTLVETALEDACGVAFVPRYQRESLSGLGFTQAILSMPRVTAVRSLTLNGAVVTDAASVVPSGSGAIHYPAGFTRGFGNYEVAYEHGWPSPPPRVSQAALRWARSILIDGPIDDRYTSVSNEVGTFALATPGLRGSVSGLPEVDATIAAYSLRACVA
jgi:hypothetical protein